MSTLDVSLVSTLMSILSFWRRRCFLKLIFFRVELF